MSALRLARLTVRIPRFARLASSNPGNFANRPKEEVREAASKGGHASHGSHEPAQTSRRGGGSTKENNPGNFANRPKDEVREAGRKGGLSAGSGGKAHSGSFANMSKEEHLAAARKGGLNGKGVKKPRKKKDEGDRITEEMQDAGEKMAESRGGGGE